MTYKYATFFKLFNALVDYFLVNLWLIVSLLVVNTEAITLSIVDDYRFHFLLMNGLWFFASTQTKLYNRILNTEAIPAIKKSGWTLIVFASITLIIDFIIPGITVPLSFLLPAILILSGVVLTWKIIFLAVRKSQRQFWIDYKKVAILGSGSVAEELYEFFLKNHNSGFIVQGYFANEPAKGKLGELPYLGRVDDSVDYAAANGISEIYSALSSDSLSKVKTLMKKADNNLIRFRFVPDLSAYMDDKVVVEHYGTLPVLSQRKEPLEVKVNEIAKQAFDYMFSAFAIVFVLSWVTPLIALAIKLDSKGPIFFRQLRSGKDNKPFFCLKFRSMHVNDDSDHVQATKFDRRITRVGAFLRKTSLDELPQFFNVIMGDMSIVGPRPHMLKHTEDYSQLINDFMVRQYVTPGITGWAQVNGLRGETKETESMNKRVKADLWYMENWSLLLDLKIVFLTMFQSIKKNEKAY